MEKIQEQLQTSVYDSYDVIVIGAGVAGIGAALAARRNGMRVLLVEKSAYTGGLATLGHVCWYLPLCDGKGRKIVGGISEELLHLSIKYGYSTLYEGWTYGISRHPNPSPESKDRYMTWFNIPAFVLAVDELMQQEGIEILFDTTFCEPVLEGTKIKGVVLQNKSGRCAYKAQAVIDCTGDSDVFFRAGAKCFDRPSMLTFWGYDTSFERMKKAMEKDDMYEAINVVKLGKQPNVAPVDGKPAEKFEISEEVRDYYGTDGWEVSKYLQESRKLALGYLKKNLRSDYTMLTVPGMGNFRTTRRITGCYELKPEDQGRHFEDSIGCTGDWRKAGPVYEIPYRSLEDPQIDNLLAAGRIIASADDAWEVTRVIPPAAMTGQAAGTAAALAVKNGVTTREIDIKQLQENLEKTGVMIHY